MKAGARDFLYIDSYNRIIMFIFDKYQIYKENIEETIPKMDAKTMLFEIEKVNFNNIKLRLHQYVGLSELFNTF